MLPLTEIGKRIQTLREELQISRAALAEACGVAETVIEKLEAGSLEQVPGDYILIAARLLKADFRTFISTDLDEIELKTRRIYRTLSDGTPRDLLAVRQFIGFCLHENELEKLLVIQRSSVPQTYPAPGWPRELHKTQGPAAARAERSRLNLGLEPINNIFSIIRSEGIRLSRQRLDRKISGLTVIHPNAGPAILVNYDEDLYRQFFSAAHEYAHVLFDREELTKSGAIVSYKFSKDDLKEIRANSFAAELLLPVDALKKYRRPHDLSSLSATIERIARDYRVNTEAVAIRAAEAAWISDRTLRSFRKEKPVVISQVEKIDPDVPINLTAQQRSRREIMIAHGLSTYYVDLCRRAFTSSIISFGRFAELLDMTPDEAAEFTQTAGLAV